MALSEQEEEPRMAWALKTSLQNREELDRVKNSGVEKESTTFLHFGT